MIFQERVFWLWNQPSESHLKISTNGFFRLWKSHRFSLVPIPTKSEVTASREAWIVLTIPRDHTVRMHSIIYLAWWGKCWEANLKLRRINRMFQHVPNMSFVGSLSKTIFPTASTFSSRWIDLGTCRQILVHLVSLNTSILSSEPRDFACSITNCTSLMEAR